MLGMLATKAVVGFKFSKNHSFGKIDKFILFLNAGKVAAITTPYD